MTNANAAWTWTRTAGNGWSVERKEFRWGRAIQDANHAWLLARLQEAADAAATRRRQGVVEKPFYNDGGPTIGSAT